MKKQVRSIIALAAIAAMQTFAVKAQTVSTFENLTLSPSSYWDGTMPPAQSSFRSGHAIFPNDTAGGYWSSGWAYSDMKDSTTAGYTNQYSSRSADGYNGSANYVVGQFNLGGAPGMQGAVVRLDSNATGKVVEGCYINNGTYAALSMKNGDSFEKKFGDTSTANTTKTNCHCAQGTYPDWFKLTIRKWYNGAMPADSVTFYLADYRFGTDTAMDYIVTKWQWVDLTSLGNVDSLQFNLSSSNNGTYGMNTPGFFCMDNFTTANSPLGIDNLVTDNSLFHVYPNPTTDMLNIDLTRATDKDLKLDITDITGQVLYTENVTSPSIASVDMRNFSNGIYFVNIKGSNTFIIKKVVKE